ncbi:uncharacterized protein K02A2.6-like [Toxorhynchites rutilus septentrionalis]|uniref:uncharacterized protein K02A2.6-like n=1 Tax=Toxorhynchites rutilus septentrionalis TaxID=329112 RepID=UPI0024797059|nr:uncharacterized protein K02A2.6-like [Toxorhynchites rutilus septentrionalis]
MLVGFDAKSSGTNDEEGASGSRMGTSSNRFSGTSSEGEHLLVCVDYYSRYLEVVEMNDISSASTIRELLTIFSRYGIPESLRADNGPQFSSAEFRTFCEEYGIHLESTIPYWPQMNGEVKRQDRSIMKRLKIAQELGQDWRKKLRNFLLMYHAAKHSTTGRAPSELMFGRRTRTKLPTVPSVTGSDEAVRERHMVEKEKGKNYADSRRRARPSSIEVGDVVLAKRMRNENKLSSEFSPEEFIVVNKRGMDVTIRSSLTGKVFNRSAAHLKVLLKGTGDSEELGEKSHEDEQIPVPVSSANKDAVNLEESVIDFSEENVITGSKRNRVEPSRLKDFIKY